MTDVKPPEAPEAACCNFRVPVVTDPPEVLVVDAVRDAKTEDVASEPPPITAVEMMATLIARVPALFVPSVAKKFLFIYFIPNWYGRFFGSA